MQHGFMGCAICGKPLRLAVSRSEDGGLPIHEECYLLRLKLKEAAPSGLERSEPAAIPASHPIVEILPQHKFGLCPRPGNGWRMPG